MSPSILTPEVAHIAGLPATINDRYLRQRCAWCGAIMLDYDLEALQYGPDTPEDERRPATWPVGDVIATAGAASWVLGSVVDGQGPRLPSQACGFLDPEATR